MTNIKGLSINKKYLETICTQCKNIKKLSVDLGPFDIYEEDSFVVDADFTCLSKLANLTKLVIGAESCLMKIPLNPRMFYDILASIVTVSKFTLHNISIKDCHFNECHPDCMGHPNDEEFISSLRDLISGLSNIEHWSLVDVYCPADIFNFPTGTKSLKCKDVSCQNFFECQHKKYEYTKEAEFVGESIKYSNLRVLQVTGDLPGKCRLVFCPHLEILDLLQIECIGKFQPLFNSNLKKVARDAISFLNDNMLKCFIPNCVTLQVLILDCDRYWHKDTYLAVSSALKFIFKIMPKLIVELHRFFGKNATVALEIFDLYIKKIRSIESMWDLFDLE